MLNFIQHMLTICKISSCILSALSILTILICVLSSHNNFFLKSSTYSPFYTHAEFHLVYSAAGAKEIRIFRMTLFSSQLLKEHYFEKSEGEIFDLKPNRNNFLYCTTMTKKYWVYSKYAE
jgi:hypothetical protein